MAYDGAIRFNSKIDNSQVEKDLKQLEKKIRQANEAISKNESAKLPLEKQLENVNQELSMARENLKRVRSEFRAAQNITTSQNVSKEDYEAATAAIPRLRKAVEQVSKEVGNLRKKWQLTKSKIDDCDLAIQRNRDSIASSTAQASALSAKMSSSGAKMQMAFTKARTAAAKFGKQILRVGASMIMFRVFSAILQGISNYMNKVLKTNDEYAAQLAQLKGALITAFQPIYEFVLPGLIAVLRVLTAIVLSVAKLLSALGGKTLAQSAENAKALNEEADAIEAVGNAAKEAGKKLANFDEINSLGAGDSGGGSSGFDAINPNFDELKEMSDLMSKILKLVTSVGAGLLAWKIAKAFTQSLKTAAGIAISIGGAFLYAFSWADALANGIEWGNLSGLLAGMVLIVGGLALTFGATGAAIGALVTGIGAMGLALYELITTGELTTQALIALEAGILAIGAGISLLTGSWIPLLVAAVVAVAVAVVKYWDEIESAAIWVWGKIKEIWNVAATWFSVNVIKPIVKFFSDMWNGLREKAAATWEGIKSVFSTVATFFRDTFTKAWQGVLNIFSVGSNIFSNIKDAIVTAFKSIVNSLIRGINAVVSVPFKSINSVLSKLKTFKILGKQPFSAIQIITIPQIPYLAQGAVLPPNKPFMAMVGDQKNGTNVEAPLATIQEALANVLAEQGTGDIRIAFTGDLAQLGRVLKPVIDKENSRVGGSLAKGAT